ncbi:MAG: hypothetical protein PF447_11795 [Spirochaetaceae bacterium]|jgi:predicted AAA+ superfamily ATPase|nr:hypothetical protein [Spirochaetaceae bacterium]
MQTFVERIKTHQILKLLNRFPVVALLGARQVGKSTLVKNYLTYSIYSLCKGAKD